MRALAVALLTLAAPAAAQDTLRLADLQRAAVVADPRARQAALAEARARLRLRSIDAERLPSLAAVGEATYQSEVARLPIAAAAGGPPAPPTTRASAALDAELLLVDGGRLGARRRAVRADEEAERSEVAAALHPLRAEVAAAYFDALLLQERLRETAARLVELEARLGEARAAVRAGAALPGDTAALVAETLVAAQVRGELAAGRRAALDVLGALAARDVDDAAVLALPTPDPAHEIDAADVDALLARRAHPRYAALAARRGALARQAEVVRAALRPQAAAFAQLGYGRPGLRQFTDDFHEYWIAGVRVRWAPWDRGETRREVERLRVAADVVATEEAAFTERLRRELRRPLRELERLRGALATDDRIVRLREQVARQARTQLDERAITASAYVDALTDLEEARVARLRHRVELAQAHAAVLTTLGLEPR